MVPFDPERLAACDLVLEVLVGPGQFRVASGEVPGEPVDLQVGAHPHQDLLALEGLDDVVDPTDGEAFQDGLGLASRGDEKDRGVARDIVPLETPAGLEAVYPRHHHVEKDEIRTSAGRDLEGRLPAGGHQDAVALGLESLAQDLQVLRCVVHQEDLGAGEIQIACGHVKGLR
jgi:hypothetical protein